MRELRLVLCLLAASVPAALRAQASTPPANGGDTPEAGAAEEEGADSPEITVTGQRPRGSAVGDIPAEVTLSPADVRSYGVSSVTDLLTELAPQTNSGAGRGGEAPVVLLNGRRISGFTEIRDLPTEAIERVDILPEDVALKYGYSANQRVVNFVLRRRFRAVTAEAGGGASTEADRASLNLDASGLRIRNDTRVNLSGRIRTSGGLRESQRGIVTSAPSQPFDISGNLRAVTPGGELDPRLSALAGSTVTGAGVPADLAARPALSDFARTAGTTQVGDLSRYRSLLPATRLVQLNAVYAHPVFGLSGSVNASLDVDTRASLLGLPTATLTIPAGDPFSPFANDVRLFRYLTEAGPLRQDTHSSTAHGGFSLTGDVAKWHWSLTGNYDHGDNRTHTDRGIDTSTAAVLLAARDPGFSPFAPLPVAVFGGRLVDRARSRSDEANVQLVANGKLLDLPAGPISTTLKLSGELRRIDSTSLRSLVPSAVSLSRRDVNGQVSVDLPLTSRRRGVLAALGDLSANLNVALEKVSDFRLLKTFGYGLNWAPIPQVRLIFGVTDDDGAPTVQQLGNPLVLTPAVRVFDFVRGETVDVTRLSGGNPNLRADSRHVTRLNLSVRPPLKDRQDLTLTANYVDSRIRNAIASFPTATAEIEAAFPDRFTRDTDGTLLRIDSRPVNFAREDREQLRWGVNFSRPLTSGIQRAFEAWRAARAAGSTAPPPFPFPAGFGGRREGTAGEAPAARPQGGGETGAGETRGGGAGASDAGTPRRAGGDVEPARGSGTGPDAAAERTGGGAGGGFGGGSGRGGFGGGGGGGRLQLAVYHTIFFRNEILIREGVPILDLLNGAATGSSGGQARHQVEVQAGYTNNGFGARLSGNWRSSTFVNGTGAANPATGTAGETLFFSPLTTLGLRLFANTGQMPRLIRTRPWLRGTRVTFNILNLLNDRPGVRGANGTTPLSYQPGYLDPLGRSVSVSVRKLFF